MGKNIRFAELVKTSGRPEVATLWQDPEKDPEFKTAIRQNRVLTVRQETVGNKKDFGEIGFKKERNVSYLIFPKPLPDQQQARIIGIKYGEVESKLTPASEAPKTPPASRKKKKNPAPIPPKKEEEEFTVVVKKTAVWKTSVKVKALSKAEAEEEVGKMVKKQTPPISEAVVEIQIQNVTRS